MSFPVVPVVGISLCVSPTTGSARGAPRLGGLRGRLGGVLGGSTVPARGNPRERRSRRGVPVQGLSGQGPDKARYCVTHL